MARRRKNTQQKKRGVAEITIQELVYEEHEMTQENENTRIAIEQVPLIALDT